MRIFTHLAGEALGHLFGALGSAILFAALGGGAVLGYGYLNHAAWPPTLQEEVLAGIIAVLTGYAAATTVLLRAIGQTVFGAAKAVEAEAKKVI